METYEVFILAGFALIVLAVAGLAIGSSIKEKVRRKKHPVWYEHYNNALANSMHIGNKFRHRIEYINKLKEVFQDKFFEGGYTEAEFNDAIDVLNIEYKDATRQFRADKEAYGIEADLKAADAYAKEHNLKWGVIYD